MRYLIYLALLLSCSSCWVARAYRIRHLNLDDHEKLPSVSIDVSQKGIPFTPGTATLLTEHRAHIDEGLQRSGTAAFIVIRNDSILYEAYHDGYTSESLLPSNSMAKSFTGTLVGIALANGLIRSTAQPITDFFPELGDRDARFRSITLQHLLDMRSGLDFSEGSYDLKDDAVKMGFRRNLVKHILRVQIAEPPGRFRYQSINTQLLGMVIERLSGKPLYTYMEEKLWNPIGAEHGATWNVDSRRRKHVITSAGLNATARDFAKLGRLYLQGGKTAGKQVVPSSWVAMVADPDTMDRYGGYKNQWWSRTTYRAFSDSQQAVSFGRGVARFASLRKIQNEYRVNYRTGSFSAVGFMNQSIYIHPEKNLVIVRIGKRWSRRDISAIQFIHEVAGRF